MLEEPVHLVGDEAHAGRAQASPRVRHSASVGSMPVGLCGAFTTTTRVAGRIAATRRATSNAHPSASRSSCRVTSAPAARATSWRLW